MYRALYENPYDTYRSQMIHKSNLRKAKAVIDVKEPIEAPHLMANAKKHEMEEGTLFLRLGTHSSNWLLL